MVLALGLLAQAHQDDAPEYETAVINYCNDNAGVLTGYTVVKVFRVGDADATNVYVYDDANVLVPTGLPATGTNTKGYCSPPAEFYDWEFELYCDAGTQFWKVVKIHRAGEGTETKTVENVSLTGATYTPSGAEVSGACNQLTEAEGVVSYTTETATGTVAASGFVQVTIYNKGLTNGTITVGAGAAEPLSPGENYEYTAWIHPITQKWMLNPVVNYDATGTEFKVITTAK